MSRMIAGIALFVLGIITVIYGFMITKSSISVNLDRILEECPRDCFPWFVR